MSLFGNYINDVLATESVSSEDSSQAFYESAMQVSTFSSDVDYFNSIFESTINEFSNFEVNVLREYTFIDEAEEGGKKNIILRAIDAIIKFFKGLVEKIKSAINFIKDVFSTIKNKKMEQQAKQDIKDLEDSLKHSEKSVGIDHSKGMSGTLNKAFEIANGCEMVGYSNEFRGFIGKVQGPESLKLDFSYKSASATNSKTGDTTTISTATKNAGEGSGGMSNLKIMGVLYTMHDEGWQDKFTVTYKRKANEKLEASLDKFTKVKNEVESYADDLKKFEKYAVDSQKVAEKAKQVAAGAEGAANTAIMRDINALSTYGKYISKLVAFMTTTSNNCAKTYMKFCGAMRTANKYSKAA